MPQLTTALSTKVPVNRLPVLEYWNYLVLGRVALDGLMAVSWTLSVDNCARSDFGGYPLDKDEPNIVLTSMKGSPVEGKTRNQGWVGKLPAFGLQGRESKSELKKKSSRPPHDLMTSAFPQHGSISKSTIIDTQG
ncbi:hypothetical protein ARMGADRAFT_1033393 [Armillaria gallica]|uniref:Uncharacterized protein n=1 Tax=Armillaria gallica TaxID=47427 RepID=A0A2H3D206_ARMGA|nr:hypothetical protein ARMGADRAFT_1033393 [Armillaria gallica]